MSTTQRNAGFTLVELAIVLVIIGLLVGGVLVGQDLIKAAEINSTTSQLSKYDSAANAFRTKYNGYPGDLRDPQRFGLASTGEAGTAGLADGNGVIQPGACSNANGYGGESGMFWRHLSETNLIPEGANGYTNYTAVAAVTIDDTYMPQARLGNGNRFHLTSVGGRNFYVLANISGTTVTTCALTAADALTPQQGFQIDSKMDDGNAATGIVVSIADAADPTVVGGGAAVASLADGDCYATNTAAPYTAGSYATGDADLASALACQLRLRASF